MDLMESKGRIKLRPFTTADLEKVRWWKDDKELAALLGLELAGEEIDYYQRCHRLLRQRSSRVFAIETHQGKFIGEIELNQITWRRKQAELHICIGERKFWDQGYGTEAVLAILEYAWEDMGLEGIYLRVYRHNRRAIRCYEKCGFRKEAVLKNALRKGNKGDYDIILMNVSLASSLVG